MGPEVHAEGRELTSDGPMGQFSYEFRRMPSISCMATSIKELKGPDTYWWLLMWDKKISGHFVPFFWFKKFFRQHPQYLVGLRVFPVDFPQHINPLKPESSVGFHIIISIL